METQLSLLLNRHDFEGSRLLLQSYLSAGDLFDPRTDRQWAPIADQIAAQVTSALGFAETIHYWEQLLAFFLGTIEPGWGHAHKGHLYFRLGLLEARRDLSKAKKWLKDARKEDVLLQRSQTSSEEEAQKKAMESSSYVALALLERIEDADFASSDENQRFMDNLFGVSFDAAIRGDSVRPDLVEAALAGIVPSSSLPSCLSLHQELAKASHAGIPFATVSLVGTVLEAVVLALLQTKLGISKLSNGKETLLAELGPLLQEAISRALFPSTSVQAACQLVHIFRNRLHPGNEMRQEHKLTLRVANTLRVLFELSLIEWWHSVG